MKQHVTLTEGEIRQLVIEHLAQNGFELVNSEMPVHAYTNKATDFLDCIKVEVKLLVLSKAPYR